jgi:hypothetical protein
MATDRTIATLMRYELALQRIAVHGCESYTTGAGSCWHAGRTPTAQYSAERCCDACIAFAALSPDRITGTTAQLALDS